jgi:hypothetical protein
MTTETISKILPEVREKAEELKKEIPPASIKAGSVTVDKATYVRLMPANVTEEMVENVQAYNSLLVAAGSLAIGELAIPAMKKDKALDRITLTIPMTGKDYIGVAFDRSRQVPSRDAENNPNGTKTKFGSTSVEIAMYGTKSRGQLLIVKNELAELAKAAFGS